MYRPKLFAITCGSLPYVKHTAYVTTALPLRLRVCKKLVKFLSMDIEDSMTEHKGVQRLSLGFRRLAVPDRCHTCARSVDYDKRLIT